MNITFNNSLEPGTGRLLISEPFLNDPFFKRTVVLLADHNEEGSLGFIMNKILDITLQQALPGFPEFEAPLHFGGPVNKDQLFYVHTLSKEIPDSIKIKKGLYWGGDFNTVKQLIENGLIQPNQIRFFVGYSGWNANQLNEEIKEKTWIVSECKVKALMNNQSSSLWSETLKSLGKHYGIIANFPEDPSMN